MARKSLMQTCKLLTKYIYIYPRHVEQRVEVAALGSMLDEFAMRRNTIAKPNYHWQSVIDRKCYCRRILNKHTISSIPALYSIRRDTNFFIQPDTQSITSLRNQYPSCEINTPCTVNGRQRIPIPSTLDHSENLKPNSGFLI